MKSREGFTLMELLVVIVIIAILGALIFPALTRMRESANQTKCRHNLRQIFAGFQNYLADHDSRLPQRFNVTSANGEIIGYDELLMRYLGDPEPAKAREFFTCPSQRTTAYPSEPGYGMNWFYDNQPLSRVENMSRTILLAETAGSGGVGSHRADRDENSPGELDKSRHGDGQSSYLFFDGHVATMKYSETRVTGDFATDMWGTDFGEHTGGSGI